MHFNQYFTESEALSKKLKAIRFVLIDNVMSEFRNTWHEENVNQDDCVIKWLTFILYISHAIIQLKG